MGIGNTTSASALVAALLATEPEAVCGRGTGVDDAGLARKIGVVRQALAVNLPKPVDGLGTLAALGGFEIGFLSGLAVGAAERGVVVLLDGFIPGAAALVAERIAPRDEGRDAGCTPVARARPQARPRRTRSRAAARARAADRRGKRAALALPIVHAALAILEQMATFESAGVTGAAG